MLEFGPFRIYFGHRVKLPNVNQVLNMYGIEFGSLFFGFVFINWGV